LGVIMDEKTANNYLLVTNGKELKMSPTASNGTNSAQRFDMKPCVLSRESYTSDISLTVDVDKINTWRIGVVTGSAKRHGFTMMQPRNFYWVIEWNGRELVALDDTQRVITGNFVQKLTMRLDFNKRELTFDADKNVNVFSFDKMYFSEPLYILFSTTDENNPLRII
ncbi:UNVERIFIED_CONTAM: hypothetical protein FKN15_041504, partial [Acipenser sinensis]